MQVVRETLVVEVEDAIWQRQLFGLSHQILERLNRCMGGSSISRVEFRIGIPRREPQREDYVNRTAARSSGPGGADEADAILDPVLKKVYRQSQKRSTA
jgi:hypothetical protein